MSFGSSTMSAYRLAGRIATLSELGIEIVDATLDLTKPGVVVRYKNPLFGGPESLDRCAECFTRSLKEITNVLGGFAAVTRLQPEYEEDWEQPEYKRCSGIASIQCRDCNRVNALVGYLITHANKIVDLRWGQVEAVAKALLAQFTLTGAEIVAILDAVPPCHRPEELGFDSCFAGRAFEQALIIREGRLPRPQELEPRCTYAKPSTGAKAAEHPDGNNTVPAQQPNHAADDVLTQPAAA